MTTYKNTNEELPVVAKMKWRFKGNGTSSQGSQLGTKHKVGGTIAYEKHNNVKICPDKLNIQATLE